MPTALKHYASRAFWECYDRLAPEIRDLADGNFELLKRDPRHPSLHVKKVGRYWSVRIGRKYRAMAVEQADGLLWFWIGTHSDYERLLQ